MVHTNHAAKIEGPKTDGKTADQYLAFIFGKLAHDAHKYGALGYQ